MSLRMAGGGRKDIWGRSDAEEGSGDWVAYDKVLQQGTRFGQIEIGAAGEMGGLLEEDGVGPQNLAGINRDFLGQTMNGEAKHENDAYQFLGGKYRVHDRDVCSGQVWRHGQDENARIHEPSSKRKALDVCVRKTGQTGLRPGGVT